MSESPIARYLDQLDCELRVKRAPRRRLLAEAADHLHSAADELEAPSVARAAAERQAVERFGAAAYVARRFAHAVASTGVRTALAWVAAAYTAYAAAAFVFVVSAPAWLRDFPQGAPSMLGLQVATVALALSGVRAWRCRGELLIDEQRLRLIANGLAVATLALAGGAACELLLAVTRPAAAPWRDAVAVIAVYAVAAAAALVAAFTAIGSLARTRLLSSLPSACRGEHGDTALLVDDVAATAAPLRPLAVAITTRPLPSCAAIAAAGFTAFAGLDLLDASPLTGAVATGLFEAVAVVVAYLGLSRALGLCAPR